MSTSFNALIPVTILTGFLGSGKTTILNILLESEPLSRAAVIVNEFGDIPIDHELVRTSSDSLVVLPSGCVCCATRGDLISALSDLWIKRVRGDIMEFERIFIETSGLADPAPIMHTVMNDPLISARYRLDGIVTTVDALFLPQQIEKEREASKQIALADRLILTKQDIATVEQTDTARRIVRSINHAAPVLTVDEVRTNPQELVNVGLFAPGKFPDADRWLYGQGHETSAAEGHRDHHHHSHDAGIATIGVSFLTPLTWESLQRAIDALVNRFGADLLRLKAVLDIDGEETPTALHGIAHVLHPPASLPQWPKGEKQSRLVLIIRESDPKAILDIIETTLGKPDRWVA